MVLVMHSEHVKMPKVSLFLFILLAGTAWAQQTTPSSAPSTPSAPAMSTSPATSDAAPPITLAEAVDAAKAAAPNLKIARASLDAARAQFDQTRAKNGLSLGATGAYSHESTNSASVTAISHLQGKTVPITPDQENVTGGVALSGPSTSLGLTAQQSFADGSPQQLTSVGLTASQTLFDGYLGGRAAALVQQADYAYRASQVTYDASLKSLILQTEQAYYTLLGDQNTLMVRQAVVHAAEENLALEQGLLRAQRATNLDVLQTQVALTQARLDLRTAQNTIDTDRRRLSLLVGWPTDRQYAVADTPAPNAPQQTLDDALKTAYQNRQELRILALNITAAGINLTLQKSQYVPVISVNGTLDLAQGWSNGILAGSPGADFTAGVSIALPPFIDGGLLSAQVQGAADQLSSLQVQLEQERQSIGIDVQNALFSVTDAKDRLDLAGQNVQQAQGVYDLQKAKLAVGLETTLDVLTAFSTLITAQVGLEQAKSNYDLALLNLNSVMGL
jgi:outer membrane protein